MDHPQTSGRLRHPKMKGLVLMLVTSSAGTTKKGLKIIPSYYY